MTRSKGGLDLEGGDELACGSGKLSSQFLELILSCIESRKVRLAVGFSDLCVGVGK